MGSAYHISVTSSQILVASDDRCEGVGMLDIVRDEILRIIPREQLRISSWSSMVQCSESQNVLRQLKTEAIDSWPTPIATSETELRSFLETSGYYRRMVPGFSKIASLRLTLCSVGQRQRKRRIPDQKKILDSSISIFVHFVNQRKPECQELYE